MMKYVNIYTGITYLIFREFYLVVLKIAVLIKCLF